MAWEDILTSQENHTATIAINRPDSLNALSPRTTEELIAAVQRAAWDDSVSVIVLTGVGDRAFCVGGDHNAHGEDGRYTGRGTLGIPVDSLHTAIREAPKPVIARVQGYAIGGGNVLVSVCDLAIASDKAVFGQVGPKVGSVDPGFGTGMLARAVGEKRAREIWMLCRRYSAEEAWKMGLVNKVVPHAELDNEVARWCEEIHALSPTALAIAKAAFNADTESLRGVGALGFQATALYYGTDEAKEGAQAFADKRAPNFRAARDRQR